MGPEGARASGGKLAAAQAPSGPGQRVDLPLPGARAGRVLGVLALEARAGGGLRDAWVERARAALRALEPLWWATAFRAARIAREGDDLAWDPERRFLGTLEPAVREAAASRVPLLLLGPCGSGRRTLARWIHFRGPSAEEAIVEGAALDPGATCIVDLETLAPVAARALSRALREASGARLVLLGRSAASRPRGPVPELARLDPLSLVVPRLCERRDEIPALVEVLAGNLARREALAPASFTDEAIGDLWRQDWPGEVAELARLVAHLARTCAGRAIGSGEVRTALLARGLEFRARLALRGASPLDLLHAIECTRHRAGSENRARAARYLGWHPATLESRLRGSATPQRGGSAPREQ